MLAAAFKLLFAGYFLGPPVLGLLYFLGHAVAAWHRRHHFDHYPVRQLEREGFGQP